MIRSLFVSVLDMKTDNLYFTNVGFIILVSVYNSSQ